MLVQFSFWIYLVCRAFFPLASDAPHAHPPSVDPLFSLPKQPPASAAGIIPPPCLTGIINDYTPVTGFGCDSSTLQVGGLTGFAAGDKVLLLQMQVVQVDLSNTAAFGTLLNTTCIGNYEFNRIQSLGGNTVQLQFALSRPYDLSGKVQLVRVPEYDSATICNLSCLPWNGSVGGVLALDVKTQLTLSGNVDVSGKGFRGGIVDNNIIPWIFGEMQYFYPPVSTLAAAKGEGVVLIPTEQSFGRGRAGNGGGGGNAHNAGGGGGGNAGAGGGGGYEILNLPGTPTPNTNGIGGQKYFDTQTNKILLGGGAGAGHANDALGSSGGNGGGIVLILANTLKTNNFRLLANGIDVFGGAEHKDGQGGGGGGGTVILKVGQITGLLGCELKGGQGGSNPYTPDFQLHGPGGGGGGGKLLLTQNSPNVLPSLQGGINGLTSQNLTNGAFPGEAGKVWSNIVVPEDVLPAHPVSNHLVLDLQSPACTGLSTGQITVRQSTAIAYRINAGPWQPDSTFSGLGPGSYLLSLRFSGGCTLDTVATLTAPLPVLDSLLTLTPANCISGGSLSVTAVSGIAPFEFQADGGPWQTSGAFTDLLPGSHLIMLRDAAGCSHSSPYTVNAAPPLLDSLLAIQDADCTSGGSISLGAVAGTAPFEFQLDGGAWQAGGVFGNLSPGNHTVLLRDAAGCSRSHTYLIGIPPALRDSLLAITNASCTAGGALDITAVSGTAPFEFQLNGGAWQSSGVFANLLPGDHVVALRDAAGCMQSDVYTIKAPPAPLDSLLNISDATCISGGSLSVIAVAGTAPFDFQLNGGAWQTSGAFANLPPGDHVVTLRDAAGCLQTGVYTVKAPPPPLDSLLSLTTASCISGGSIGVTATAGTAPFEFQLDGGAWQSGGTFSNLPPGGYQITLRDAAGCTHTDTYTVNPAPPALDSLLDLTKATCIAGGSISVGAVAGTAPFAFQLDGGAWQANGTFINIPPGDYTVTLRDAAGCTHATTYTVGSAPPALDSLLTLTKASCIAGGLISVAATAGTAPFQFQLDGGPWQGNGDFANLPPGNHTVTLRDAAGCSYSETYFVDAPPPVQDSLLAITDATCMSGGTISITAITGTAPFQFQLDGGVWQATGSFVGLPAGAYILTLRDAAGCTHSNTYTINTPAPVQDSLLGIVAPGCLVGGMISVLATAGSAPFAFQLNGGVWQSGGSFVNLPPGDYTVILRDAAGCTHSEHYTLHAPPPVLDSLINHFDATCIAGGSLSVAALGGTPPFAFQLDGSAWQATGDFSDLPPGSYTVILHDAAGCTHTGTYGITAPPPVQDSVLAITQASCTAGGSLSLVATEGTAPFEFQMSGMPWQSSGLFTDLPPGNFIISLRDAAGCIQSGTYMITAEPPLAAGLDSLGNVDCQQPTGWLAASVTGGTAPYVYLLEPGDQLQSSGYFPGLAAGSYTLRVTDAAGCQVFLTPLEVGDLVDTALTQETVTIYEGGSYQLPDGRRTAKAGQYFFPYLTVKGCDSLHIIELIVLQRHVYVPNVFSPGNDGGNNFFTVFSDESLATVRKLQVFDRWGELIFEKQDLHPNQPENGWDGNFRGQPVATGVFVWFAELEFTDGLKRTIWGDLTVVR